MRKEEISSFLERLKEEVQRSAAELSRERMPELPMELFGLYEKTGDRKEYDGVYLTRRKYLAVFGLSALMHKSEEGSVPLRDVEILSGIMEEICREECWAVPAHVDRLRQDWRITADLFACETAQTLAELSDRLSKELPGAVRSKVRENIERRIFRPFFSQETPSFWWEVCDTNWNAVCAGCIGSACLHLLREEKERLAGCVNRIVRALVHYIDGFSEDGACLEGPGYYTYGMTYFVNFAQELYEYSGGERNLFSGKWEPGVLEEERARKLRRMAEFLGKCFFRDGRMIRFSDDSSEDTFRLGLHCVMAAQYPGLQFPPVMRAAGLHTDFCYRFAALKMALLETRRYLELPIREASISHEETQSFRIFPKAQWCVGNAASGIGFACKGGHNGEPHNHNDIGHFIYERDGVLLLTDLGAGEYTKEYFGENRYSILCNSSFGHSVPVIDGLGQCAGKEHGCRQFRADPTGRVEMELCDAYPRGMLFSFRRCFHFDLRTGHLEVEDFFRFRTRGGAVAEESLITQIEPVITPEGILLERGETRCIVIPKGACAEQIHVEERIHRSHRRENEKVYLIRWRAKTEGQTARGGFRVC